MLNIKCDFNITGKYTEIYFKHPQELWELLKYIETTYPSVRWLEGQRPTKWFPDEPHEILKIHPRGGREAGLSVGSGNNCMPYSEWDHEVNMIPELAH